MTIGKKASVPHSLAGEVFIEDQRRNCPRDLEPCQTLGWPKLDTGREEIVGSQRLRILISKSKPKKTTIQTLERDHTGIEELRGMPLLVQWYLPTQVR